jgi:hypothetical protein
MRCLIPQQPCKQSAVLFLATLVLVAPASIANAASRAPRIGAPVPTRRPPGLPPVVSSSPPDLTASSRPAISADTQAATSTVLPAGYKVVDAVVANSNPNLASTDTYSDSETSLAVNSNTNQLAIYAFQYNTPTSGALASTWGSGNAPIWYSSNGGATWTKKFTVQPPTGVSESGANAGCPCDATLDYDRSSNLFGTFLNYSPQDIYTGDTSDPTKPAGWQWQWHTTGGVADKTNLAANGMADQPWLRVNRDPFSSTQDDAYVGYDDDSANTVRVAVALGSRPPYFSVDSLVGTSGGGINPGMRLAPDPRTGTIYAIWQLGGANPNPDGSKAISYNISRSTNAGNSWSLNGSSSGIVAAKANSDQPTPKFGTVNALRGGVDAGAVDPTNGDFYYVYGKKDASTGNNRLAIRRLTGNGSGGLNIGSEHFVTGQVQAALPSVAVTANDTVGVLYDTFDGTDASGYPKFSTHLAQSVDHGTSFFDTVLATFLSPETDDGTDGQRVLGDYQQLRSVGNRFFGAFAANGAAFGRSQANIDPIFFSAPAMWVQTVSAAGENASEPAVGVDQSGNSVLAWERDDGTTGCYGASCKRIQARSRTSAGTLSAVQTLSAAGENATGPRVAVDPTGDAVFTWLRPDGTTGCGGGGIGCSRIQAVARSSTGTLSAVQTLSAAGQNAYSPNVAIDQNGNAVFTWTRSDGTNIRVEAIARSSTGTLSAVQTLSAAGQNAYSPDVGADQNGDAVFTWVRPDGTTSCQTGSACGRIQAVARSATGALSAVQTLSAAGKNAAGPQVAVDKGGDAVFVWRAPDATTACSNGSCLRIQAVSRAATGTLSAVQALSAGGQDADFPNVGVDQTGDAVFTWVRSDGTFGCGGVYTHGCYRIQAVARSAAGALSAVQTLSDAGANAFFPDVAVDPTGDAGFVWTSPDATTDCGGYGCERVQERARSAAGALNAVQTLSVAGQHAAHGAQVGVDSHGKAIAAWKRFDGTYNRIQVSP